MLKWCYYYSVDSKPEILQLFKGVTVRVGKHIECTFIDEHL